MNVEGDPKVCHGQACVKGTRIPVHQRVMQAMTLFAVEEWSDLMVVMRDVMQSIWRTGGKS
ncbi:MAG: DUF433 domain-containing protein [Euryarchaeota archaeon]|nr:DUF433 domain-containing protein [Euryarchaeota archaeon]